MLKKQAFENNNISKEVFGKEGKVSSIDKIKFLKHFIHKAGIIGYNISD